MNKASDEYIKIMVEDTGGGISSEDKDHIFSRFYRTASARASDNQGSGLGLAIGRGWEDTNSTATVTDGQNTWVGVSYQTKNLSSLGSSHIRLTYAESEDMTTEGDSAEKVGIQFVQMLPAGTSVHMGWEESEYESTTIKTYDDVTSFIAGALIKF